MYLISFTLHEQTCMKGYIDILSKKNMRWLVFTTVIVFHDGED